MAASHLAKAERGHAQAEATDSASAPAPPPLPERFVRAQASRPKVVDLSNGEIATIDVAEPPRALTSECDPLPRRAYPRHDSRQ